MDVAELPGPGLRPLLSLSKHYRVSIVLWVLVLMIGLPIAWIKGQSYYVAQAVFQVSPTYMKNLAGDKELEFQSNSQYREYVNHLSNTVVRYDVLEHALARLRAKGIETRPPALTERKHIEQLQRQVQVRAIPDTYMVRIILEGPERANLADLVNAITESFLETTRNEQIFGSTERLTALEENAETLRREIAQFEAQRVALAEKLGLTTFGENTQNPYDTMLAQAREKLMLAAIERAQAEAALAAFMSKREIPTSFGRSLLEMRLQDNGLQALRNEVVRRSEELRRIIAGLEEKHPARAPAIAELEAINQRLQAREAEFETHAFEDFRLRLTATLGQTQQVEEEVKSRMLGIQGQASDFARNFQQAMRYTSEIRKRAKELDDYRDRFNFLASERNAIGFVRLVTPALPAETPMGPGKTKLMIGVVLAAFILALVAPIAIDMLDRRLRTVNEAMKLMGIPAAGWQVRVENLATRIFADEQTRRFASALMRGKAQGGRQAFAFTSVKSGGGTTTVILDSARVLQQLGLRVLVVIANNISNHHEFDESKPGLSDYLDGTSRLDELPQPYLHREVTVPVVGIGSHPSASLKRLDLLRDAVSTWSTEYDFVLFDLPPILQSADTEFLVGVLGQVFLVVEAESVTKGEVSRAKRLLHQLDPDAVGLFVNRIPTFGGEGYLRELVVETVTGSKFSDFMSMSRMRLEWELLRTRWSAAWRERPWKRKP